MREIQLLDCTLRDGGYVNDWEYGHHNLTAIFERLVDADVDIVEIGFIDERRPFDINRSIMPDTESSGNIYGKIKKRPKMVVGMIDYGTCGLEHVQPCSESYLDGIRVIFKKHIMHEAMAFCGELKKLGYIVFSQLVSITTYSDEELEELIQLVNEVKPYAVSMVDTYGLLDPAAMLHYYDILDEKVDRDVRIGFHGHNNFQLAYANSRAFLEKETTRNIIVDGTLFGMGKNAGNAPIELLAMYLNRSFGKNYNINSMLEAIDESIMDFYKKTPWGYKVYHYLSAYNKCHPYYIKQLQDNPSLSVSTLNDLLGQIEPVDAKLLYKKEVGDRTLETFGQKNLNDKEAYAELSRALLGKKILVIGPGKNIQLQSEKVNDFIQKNKPTVISINYIPGAYKTDYVFVTKPNRYCDMADDLLEIKNMDIKIIATSNVTPRNGAFAYSFARKPLLEANESIVDNSFLMLLKIFAQCDVSEIFCAGLDGYSDKEDNYFNPKMEYSFVKEEARHLNFHIREVINETYSNMKIHFITYSHYTDSEDSYDAGF